MKKKSSVKTVVLTIITIALWAFIAYKIYDYVRGPAEQNIGKTNALPKQQDERKEQYELMLSYDDPFKAGSRIARTTTAVKATRPNKKISGQHKSQSDKITDKTADLKVIYQGIVEAPGINKTGVFNIDGRECIGCEGDTISAYVIFSITENKLVLYDYAADKKYEYEK